MAEIPYLIPIWETLQAAWSKVKGTKGSIWLALLLFFLLYIAMELVNLLIVYLLPSIQGVPEAFIQIICTLLQMGIIYIGIARAKDFPFTYKMLFRPLNIKIALKIIGSYILQALIGLFFFLFILIPGALISNYPDNNLFVWLQIAGFIVGIAGMIYVTIRMYFAIAFVLDRDAWPWQSIKLSFQATRGNFWRILFLILVSSFLILLSAIPLGIGLIWTFPWYYILYGVMYKRLTENQIDNKIISPS